MGTLTRVDVTPGAKQLIEELREEHGDLLFHQSGGCCDGSAPMCYPRGDFKVGSRDVFLGVIADTPFYMGGDQFEYWKHTHLTIDVVPGRGSGFSVEAPHGVRFLTRSRVLSTEEIETLGEPARGPEAMEPAGSADGGRLVGGQLDGDRDRDRVP